MEQLPLHIPAQEPSFETFVAGSNGEALAAVRALAAGTLAEAIVFLWGEPGSGRSHLLRAASRQSPQLFVADDVEALDEAAQQQLFNAINAARDGRLAVLAAGSAPPAGLAVREDVRTRLAWGLVYQLKPLSDADKAEHLRAEAARRGLDMPPEVVAYLLARLPRDLYSLTSVLDTLDREALARQRGLTVPLVREVLQSNNPAKGRGK
ncbi:MAG: DnaA regulatory inactivator Hda, partial [Betaproteobacteria bacterium]|nr:DnaA regulatory inactivator Hda [Betaproteobacteria bacterium]